MAEKTETRKSGWLFGIIGVVCINLLAFLGACSLPLSQSVKIICCVVLAIVSSIYTIVEKGQSLNFQRAKDKANELRRIYLRQFTNVIGQVGSNAAESLELYQATNRIAGTEETPFPFFDELLERHTFCMHAKATCGQLTKLIANVTGCKDLSVSIVWSKGNHICTEAADRCAESDLMAGMDVMGVAREISDDTDKYYDQRYFYKYLKGPSRGFAPEIVVSPSKAKTETLLRNTKGKWEQFVFVPILDMNKSLVGLIEVFTGTGNFLKTTEDELIKFANRYIYPFVDVFRLWNDLRNSLHEPEVKEALKNGKKA